MALTSPSNLSILHACDRGKIKALLQKPSNRYQDGPSALTIPDPALFRELPEEDPGAKALPTISECAVHLEMLEVFHTLQQDVIHSKELDETFDIEPQPRTVYERKWLYGGTYALEPKVLKDQDFAKRRKEKWTSFLRIAAERFHDWIQTIDNHLKQHADSSSATSPKYLLLPPIDVLVVWHAFLLNCDDFKNYCNDRELNHIQSLVFPWTDIHNSIDRDKWSYALPTEQSKWLRETAGIDENLMDLLIRAGKDKESEAHGILRTFSSPSSMEVDERVPLLRVIKRALTSNSQNEQLVQNVQRQCDFVAKMHAHRWIRSPAVEGTLRRAVDRYDKFLHLFRLYPNHFLVPTLDIDLVWHTHQCNAENYRTFSMNRIGRFVNHNDKVGQKTLDIGFNITGQWYRVAYGEQYQVCLCWSCQAVLSAVEKLDEEVLDNIEPPTSGLASQIDREVHYYREAEIGRRLGRELPIWNHQ